MDDLSRYSSWLTSLAAVATAMFSSLAIKVDFPFDDDHVPSSEARVSKGLAIVVSVALLAWLVSDTGAVDSLARSREALPLVIGVLIVAVMAYFSIRALALYQLKGSDGRLLRYLGGMWLTHRAKQQLRSGTSNVTTLLAGDAAKLSSVWSRSSRMSAYLILLIAGVTTIVGSTTAATLSVHIATKARDYSRAVFAWVVQDYVNAWGNQTFNSLGALPAEFKGSSEYVIALWASRNQGLQGAVSAEHLERCSDLVKSYLTLANRHEERLEWFGRQKEYFTDVVPDSRLAANARMEQVESIASLVLTSSPDSTKFRAQLDQGFSIVSDLTREPILTPAQVTRLKYLRVVLHHKNAQTGKAAPGGYWDSSEMAAAVQLANELATNDSALSPSDLGTVINVTMRTLNEMGDHVSSREAAIKTGTDLLVRSRHRALAAQSELRTSNFALVVNFAKLNEENVLMRIYDKKEMTPAFVTSSAISRDQVVSFIEVLQQDTLMPLKLVQAHLRSESNWSHWGNVTLDLARSYALLSELFGMIGAADERRAAADTAIAFLADLAGKDEVAPAAKRRLFTDPGNRPEYSAIRDDPRVHRILDYWVEKKT